MMLNKQMKYLKYLCEVKLLLEEDLYNQEQKMYKILMFKKLEHYIVKKE